MVWILVGLAGAALLLSQLPLLAGIGLSALPLAVLIGALYGNSPFATEPTARTKDVLGFAQQKLLRLGIILFGFNLSLTQLVAVGWPALVADAIMIVVVLSFGVWFGIRCLKMSPELASLASVGSAVCGAAAIMAANPVIKGRDQDVTLAVALVVIFGTLAMFTYPLLFAYSGLDPAWFGIYIGSTVHEVAQAVAAGQSMGAETMEFAVVTKLVRVMMLAPVVLVLAQVFIRLRRNETTDDTQACLPVPWFVFGFML
ncbi:MAG: putative sulfate exporter family transporter, partial [Saccharospirillum sp.]